MVFDIYPIIRPILFSLDAELAHNIAINALKCGLLPKASAITDPLLKSRVFGLDFATPIGLAAGFDKNATAIKGVLNMGFGSVELGSVTPKPQPGNPRPRLFRLPAQQAVINRFGFNSDGHDVVKRRIAAFVESNRDAPHVPIGMNVGANKTSVDIPADYVRGIKAFSPLVDYITINVSSPNTPGLRDMQRRALLLDLLKQALDARASCTRKMPLLVKIAPDLTDDQAQDIADVALASGIDGLIVSNTTITRPETLPPTIAKETGGLSGAPLRILATKMVAKMYQLTSGKIPLVGCGGISSGADAYVKIRAGASLVQIYTSLIYRGPYAALTIAEELSALLRRDGYANVAEAVGADFRRS